MTSNNPPSSSATTYSSNYNPFHIPAKYTLSTDDVSTLNLGLPAAGNAAGQAANAPNRLDNAANGSRAPAPAANHGNAANRSTAGSARGGPHRTRMAAALHLGAAAATEERAPSIHTMYMYDTQGENCRIKAPDTKL